MRTRPSWRAALGAVASPEHRTLICDEFISVVVTSLRVLQCAGDRGPPRPRRETDTRPRRARAPPRAAARESFTPLHTYQNKIFHY